MTIRNVRIVGGGPAGLFAARLLKLAHPGWEVRLHERLPAEDTFGFGVGVSARTLDNVRAADAAVADDLVAAAYRYSVGEFRLSHGTVQIPGFHSGVAIGRAALLRCLTRHAEDAGVKIEVGVAPAVDELVFDSDLLVAADGVNSGVRTALADRFEPTVTPGRGNFFWCGADVRLPGTVFAPVVTEFGVFTPHAYPYATDRSTFVIEASDETVRNAGLAGATFDTDAASDERSIAYLSEIFAPLTGGVPFLGNRSRWMHFRTVRCARWSDGAIALLGDAAATAHPTVGSGTKLALESAIALAAALDDTEDVPAALSEFERGRRPAVEYIQDMARRSQLWWESFDHRLDLDPSLVATGFLSRAGAVSLDSLAESGPDLARRAAAAYVDADPADVPDVGIAQWVVDRPLDVPTLHVERRVTDPVPDTVAVDSGDAWGPPGDAVLAQANRLVAAGAAVVRLTGPAGVDALRDRLAMGERLRRDGGLLVQVGGPAELLDELADGLVGGRTDLICLDDGEAEADDHALRTDRFRVAMGDTDAAQLIYFGAPLRWAERLVTGFLADNAVATSSLLADGHGMPAAQMSIRYHRPLRLDDRVRGELHVQHRSRRSITWRCDFFPDDGDGVSGGARAVDVVLTQVYVDLADGTPTAVGLPERLVHAVTDPGEGP